ncbi:unnamed protein product, partial [Didymodactylos carnosus]
MLESVQNTTATATNIQILNIFTRRITLYLGIPFYLIGIIGGIFNTLMFTNFHKLRVSSCGIYLLLLNIIDLVLLNNSLLIRVLQYGFNYDLLISSKIICKIRFYVGHLSVMISFILIILASLERYGKTLR